MCVVLCCALFLFCVHYLVFFFLFSASVIDVVPAPLDDITSAAGIHAHAETTNSNSFSPTSSAFHQRNQWSSNSVTSHNNAYMSRTGARSRVGTSAAAAAGSAYNVDRSGDDDWFEQDFIEKGIHNVCSKLRDWDYQTRKKALYTIMTITVV